MFGVKRGFGAVLGVGALVALSAVVGANPAFAIRGGTAVTDGEFGFVGELQYREPGSSQWETDCTASLVDARAILTAAHCIPGQLPGTENLEFRFVFGRDETTDPIEVVVDEMYFEAVVVHPDYHPDTGTQKDVAIVVLSEELDGGITPVGLPHLNERPMVGEEITASGWGRLEDDTRPLRQQKVDIPVVECFYPTSLICLSAPRRAVNRGDSGGPGFQTHADGTVTQYGVVHGSDWWTDTSFFVDLGREDLWDSLRQPLRDAGVGHLIPT